MANSEKLVYPMVEIDQNRGALYVIEPETQFTQVVFLEGDLHEAASRIASTAVSTEIYI